MYSLSNLFTPQKKNSPYELPFDFKYDDVKKELCPYKFKSFFKDHECNKSHSVKESIYQSAYYLAKRESTTIKYIHIIRSVNYFEDQLSQYKHRGLCLNSVLKHIFYFVNNCTHRGCNKYHFEEDRVNEVKLYRAPKVNEVKSNQPVGSPGTELEFAL